MSPRFAAPRFSGLTVGGPASPTGGGVGLGITPTGALAMVDGDDSVRQAILLLLSTRPGEPRIALDRMEEVRRDQ